jgi:Na+/H+-dicarboxylate symporter
MKLATKTFVGIVLGLLTGLVLSIYFPNIFKILNEYIFDPVGTLFIDGIKMTVVPLVFFSIVSGVTTVADPKKLGRIGGKTILIFLLGIAVSTGLIWAGIIDPGENVNISKTDEKVELKEAPSMKDILTNIVPSNPVKAMAEGDMLQILFFALMVGIGMALLKEKTKHIQQFIEQANEVMMKLVGIIVKVIPYAAFALIARAVGEAGIELMGSIVWYMLTVLVGLVFHGAITYSAMIIFLARRSPLHFYRKMAPAMQVAFSTSSSAATLPVTMECVEKGLKVPKSICSLVVPLGTTINMDGTAIMHGVASVFIAQLYGVDLSLTDQLTIVLTSTLASAGAPAIPGAALVPLTMVLTSVGLPVDGAAIAIIIGVDRLIDMAKTVINVTGDAVCSTVVCKMEESRETPSLSTDFSRSE